MKQLIWLGTLKDLFACAAIFCFFMAIVLYSCADVETGPEVGMQQYEINKTANEFGDKFEIIQIDSCEYIYSSLFTREGLLTNKGNCKNPIHIYNK